MYVSQEVNKSVKVERGVGDCLTRVSAVRDGLCEEVVFQCSLRGAGIQHLGTLCQAQEEARVHRSQNRCDQGTGWTQEGWCSRGRTGFPPGEMGALKGGEHRGQGS